jgi:Immunity protein 8
MRATLLRLHSPDVHDLSSWSPDGDFGILVQLLVGPVGGPGEESFDITLCTAGWLAARARKERIVDARHHVIVHAYDYDLVEQYLRARVAALEGSTWDEVAERLGRLGHWEFEDYRE